MCPTDRTELQLLCSPLHNPTYWLLSRLPYVCFARLRALPRLRSRPSGRRRPASSGGDEGSRGRRGASHALAHRGLRAERLEHLRRGGRDDIQPRELDEHVEHLGAKVHAGEFGEARELSLDCDTREGGMDGDGTTREKTVRLEEAARSEEQGRAVESRSANVTWSSRLGARTFVRGQRGHLARGEGLVRALL